MKRFSSFLTLLLMAALPLTFISCDDDWYDEREWYDHDDVDDAIELAQMLNGTWSGTIINEYTNDVGVREQTQCSADFTFVQYSVNAISGTGYETDYDGSGRSQTLPFKWYVDERTEDVHITYTESGYHFILDESGNSKYSGFSLDNGRFNGVMEGVNNDEYIFFNLYRVRGYNAPHKLGTATDSASTVSFGKGEGKQFEASDVPVMLRKR